MPFSGEIRLSITILIINIIAIYKKLQNILFEIVELYKKKRVRIVDNNY